MTIFQMKLLEGAAFTGKNEICLQQSYDEEKEIRVGDTISLPPKIGYTTETSADFVVSVILSNLPAYHAGRLKDIGFVFQSFNLITVLSIWENITLPIKFAGMSVDEKYVEELMEMLEITEKRDALPATLSGGQQQRAAIARALDNKPSIIFADEPTGNLDAETGNKVFALLVNGIRRYHRTMVMVTHDMDIAKQADVIVRMDELK